MARPIWTFINQLVAGTTAKSGQVNDNLTQIQQAFVDTGAELNRAIRFTDADITTEAALQVAGNAAARANKTFAFNSAGTGVELISVIFNPRGNWVTATSYSRGDLVMAGNEKSLYYCAIAHTSGTFATDLAAVRWVLVLDNTAAYQASYNAAIITNAMSPYTAVAGDDLLVDVSAGPVTITLPGSPTIALQPVFITHIDGDIGTNPITVARNGQLIMGLSENMTINTTNASLALGFSDAGRGWRLVRGV
jgi:hypothetical protein